MYRHCWRALDILESKDGMNLPQVQEALFWWALLSHEEPTTEGTGEEGIARPDCLFVQPVAGDSYVLHKHWRHLNENQLPCEEACCQNGEAFRHSKGWQKGAPEACPMATELERGHKKTHSLFPTPGHAVDS